MLRHRLILWIIILIAVQSWLGCEQQYPTPLKTTLQQQSSQSKLEGSGQGRELGGTYIVRTSRIRYRGESCRELLLDEGIAPLMHDAFDADETTLALFLLRGAPPLGGSMKIRHREGELSLLNRDHIDASNSWVKGQVNEDGSFMIADEAVVLETSVFSACEECAGFLMRGRIDSGSMRGRLRTGLQVYAEEGAESGYCEAETAFTAKRYGGPEAMVDEHFLRKPGEADKDE